ncbi:hypothetical protein HanIR_Chr06g0257511 [Helianthus annuus]|nr:hypothetical protein HanIR_Chr06g0257511 [Helianthus annuus]
MKFERHLASNRSLETLKKRILFETSQNNGWCNTVDACSLVLGLEFSNWAHRLNASG